MNILKVFWIFNTIGMIGAVVIEFGNLFCLKVVGGIGALFYCLWMILFFQVIQYKLE